VENGVLNKLLSRVCVRRSFCVGETAFGGRKLCSSSSSSEPGSVELSLVRRRLYGAGSSSCRSLVRSFVVVRVLVLALALLAASFVSFWGCRGGTCRRTEGEPADKREVSIFFLHLVFLGCVCVCEASSVRIELE